MKRWAVAKIRVHTKTHRHKRQRMNGVVGGEKILEKKTRTKPNENSLQPTLSVADIAHGVNAANSVS